MGGSRWAHTVQMVFLAISADMETSLGPSGRSRCSSQEQFTPRRPRLAATALGFSSHTLYFPALIIHERHKQRFSTPPLAVRCHPPPLGQLTIRTSQPNSHASTLRPHAPGSSVARMVALLPTRFVRAQRAFANSLSRTHLT